MAENKVFKYCLSYEDASSDEKFTDLDSAKKAFNIIKDSGIYNWVRIDDLNDMLGDPIEEWNNDEEEEEIDEEEEEIIIQVNDEGYLL